MAKVKSRLIIFDALTAPVEYYIYVLILWRMRKHNILFTAATIQSLLVKVNQQIVACEIGGSYEEEKIFKF